MTIADRLTLLGQTKTAIKNAIEAKGITVGSVPFSQYAGKISQIEVGAPSEPSIEWTQSYYNSVYAEGPGSWSRPEWRELPSTLAADEIFIGLYAIHPEGSNFCSLAATGDYTVDWGDGTVENFSSNVQADHVYDYSNALLNDTNAPVSFSDATSRFTRSSHGYQDGMTVSFWNISSTTEINVGIKYYIVNATTDTFQISSTAGGSAITLTSSGTATLTSYKQAIIKVSAQENATLTAINITVRHPSFPSTLYNTNWLDIILGNEFISSLNISPGTADTGETKNLLERVRVTNFGSITSLSAGLSNLKNLKVIEFPEEPNSITDVTNLFYGCVALKTVPNFDTSLVQLMSSMFYNCTSLETIPNFNTSALRNVFSIFYNCDNLRKIPTLDLQNLTNAANMFYGCGSLEYVPELNLPSVTTINQMFYFCDSIRQVSLINLSNLSIGSYAFYGCQNLKEVNISGTTSALTDINSMFYNCNVLESVPLFDTSSVTAINNMFYNCFNLKSVPLFNTGSVSGITMAGMFYGCQSLETVPLLNTSNITSMSTMFQNCYALKNIPEFDTSKVTSLSNAFRGCRSLQSIPALVVSTVTSISTAFTDCCSLKRIEAKDFKITFSIANCSLSADALNEIYTNLPVVTGRTITVTGNYGTASDTPSIATAKGWTVTG